MISIPSFYPSDAWKYCLSSDSKISLDTGVEEEKDILIVIKRQHTHYMKEKMTSQGRDTLNSYHRQMTNNPIEK